MTAEDFLLGLLIFAASILYSSVGHAGASGYLAAMALFGLAPEAMRPTALGLNIIVASIAVYRYSRAGQNDLKLLLPFVAASIPAAFIGGSIDIPPAYYRPLVGIVLIFSAAQMARTAQQAAAVDATAHRPPLPASIAAGGALGLLAGLTGTGGGIFLSPLLLFMRWAPTRHASGIAATFILLNSVSGLAGTSFSTAVLPAALPIWGVAVLAGGLIGTQLGTRLLPVPGIRYALAAVLVVAGAKMIFT